MHVDLPEGSQGGGYAAQFTLKPVAFVLKLVDGGLQHCLGHEVILFPPHCLVAEKVAELRMKLDFQAARRNAPERD